jgi:hypothetical protein
VRVGAEKFWEYQSALFGTIERWGKPGDQTAVYESLATAQGLDLARFRSCMRSHVMRAVIEGDRVRMQQAGVQSTPSFFVGSQAIAGAQPRRSSARRSTPRWPALRPRADATHARSEGTGRTRRGRGDSGHRALARSPRSGR